MSVLTWAEVAPLLADWDRDDVGMLLDVAVHDTTIDDWQNLLDALPLLQDARATCTVDGEPATWPTDAVCTWRLAEDASIGLEVRLPHLELTGHVFGITEIDFDVEIRSLSDATRWSELIGFGRWLHTLLGRPVDVASEYDHTDVVTRVTGT